MNPIDQLKVIGKPTRSDRRTAQDQGTARYAYEHYEAAPTGVRTQ